MTYPAALTVGQLNQTHPSYDGDGLAARRALYAGGAAWRALLDRWLPRHEVEPHDAHKARKDAATYENHFGPALDMLSGHLFATPPTLTGGEGDYWTTLHAGRTPETSWGRWWRARVTEALWAGRAWVWLDTPSAGPAASLAEQVRSGALDAFLRSLDPEAVIDWSTDEAGVVWLRARQVVLRADSPVSPRQSVYRWTCIDRYEIAEYEWTPKEGQPEPTKEDLAYLRQGFPVAHGWTDVTTGDPAAPVYQICLDGALNAGERMQDPAIAHLRGRNELQHALFRAAVVLMWVRSRWGESSPPTLGQGAFLKLVRDKDGADEAGFLEPPGAVFAALSEDCDKREAALYRVVSQMAVAIEPSAAASGDSKRQDWRAMEIVLSALADVALGAMRWAVGTIAALRREKPPKVGGLDGWQREESTDWMTLAALSPELKRSPTAVTLIAMEQARRLFPDMPADQAQEIEEELVEAGAMAPPPPPARPGQPPPGADDAGEPAQPAGEAGEGSRPADGR